MADSPLPIRVAQTLGLTTSLLLGGANLALSVHLIPRLLESPTPLLVRQWHAAYLLGKRTFPPLALLSSLSYFYLAYKGDALEGNRMGYLIAGLLTVGIVPYTALVMRGTNNKLIERRNEVGALGNQDTVVEVGLGNESAHALVDWWGVLNLGRGAMLSIAGIVGVWTALN